MITCSKKLYADIILLTLSRFFTENSVVFAKFSPLLPDVYKMFTHTITILQHLL